MSIDFQILVSGKPISKYLNDEKTETYVEGRQGSEYTIRVKNNSSNKVKAVISVDGKNVLTGDSTWERGYSLEKYQTVDIPGWRIDKDNVAKFVFSDLKDTYHGVDGKAENTGCIGLLAYKEQVLKQNVVIHHHINQPPIWPSWQFPYTQYSLTQWNGTCNSSNISNIQNTSAMCAAGSNAVSNLAVASVASAVANEVGTGWGETKEFKTETDYASFELKPFVTKTIFYDSLKGLERRGIKVIKLSPKPNPFPNSDFGCPIPK